MLDGRQPVAGGGGAPELARPAEVIMAGARGGPVPGVAVAGGGVAGPRSSPASWGSWPGPRSWPASLVILVGGPRRPRFPSDRLPVAVRLGAGARPPAGVIMAGGLRRPRRWPQWVLRLVFVEIKMAAFGAARDGTEFKKDKQRARVYPFQADTGIGPYHRFP
jgi:hypothetical protein